MRDILLVCGAGGATVRLECRVVRACDLCDAPEAPEAGQPLLLDKQPRVEVVVRLLGAGVQPRVEAVESGQRLGLIVPVGVGGPGPGVSLLDEILRGDPGTVHGLAGVQERHLSQFTMLSVPCQASGELTLAKTRLDPARVLSLSSEKLYNPP